MEPLPFLVVRIKVICFQTTKRSHKETYTLNHINGSITFPGSGTKGGDSLYWEEIPVTDYFTKLIREDKRFKHPENGFKCVTNVLFVEKRTVEKFFAWIVLLWGATYGHTF